MASTTVGSSASMGPPLVRWCWDSAGLCPVRHNDRWTFFPWSWAVHPRRMHGGDNGLRGGGHGQDQTQWTLPVRERQQGQTLLLWERRGHRDPPSPFEALRRGGPRPEGPRSRRVPVPLG